MSSANSQKYAPEADFAAMADNLPEIAWITNPQGGLTWVNQRWCDYTGTTIEQVKDWDWQSVHDPHELPSVVDRWRQSLASGEPFEMTFPIRGQDGVYRPFLTRARPLRNAKGEITSWFGINTDISALHEASNELTHQKRLLETLNSTAASVAAELNLERLVQMVTDVAVELTGAHFGAFFYNVLKDSGESYTLYTISGVPREKFSQFPMPRATGVFQPTFRGVGIVRSDDITQDERYGHNTPYKGMPEGHLPVRSYLAAPVVSRSGEVLGGLFFGHAEPGRFTLDHEHLMSGLAAQAGIAIDNSRLYENAQREIAERKQAEEARLLVLRELNHRVKNLFAVAIGMVGMTSRTAGSTEDMAASLIGRLRALARAHELIRSAISSDNQQSRHTSLEEVICGVLEAHAPRDGNALAITGPAVDVSVSGATSLALILHELSTNAAKYGAFSAPAGKVSIAWRADDGKVTLVWTERGGPQIESPPTHRGFGADLSRMSARGQLGGDIAYDWQPDGVVITLTASLDRLAA